MHITAIKTRKISPKECLEEILGLYVPVLQEKDILVITSKIVSLCQGRIVDKEKISKPDLIKQEAEAVLQTQAHPYHLYLTLKEGILIPSAGIDESNGDDMYILYPENIQHIAIYIWQYLLKKHTIQSLGIVITDSHTTILRRGVTGIALG